MTEPTNAAIDGTTATPTATSEDAAASLTEALAQPAADAQPAPTPTDGFDIASLAEPSLRSKVTLPVRILDFKPAVKRDSTEIYGWEFKVGLLQETPDDTNPPGSNESKLPVGYEIPFLRVFTIPNEPSRIKEKTLLVAKMLCALNEIVCDPKADPGLKGALTAYKALPAEKRTPLPADDNLDHYKQWIGTVVMATLKPKGVDQSGRPQISLEGMTAYTGAANPI